MFSNTEILLDDVVKYSDGGIGAGIVGMGGDGSLVGSSPQAELMSSVKLGTPVSTGNVVVFLIGLGAGGIEEVFPTFGLMIVGTVCGFA